MALARSRRSGPNGEIQFTPTPTDTRGLGELPRKSSLNPGVASKDVGLGTVLPARSFVQSGVELLNDVNPVVPDLGAQKATMSVSVGWVMLHNDPAST